MNKPKKFELTTNTLRKLGEKACQKVIGGVAVHAPTAMTRCQQGGCPQK